MVSATSLSIPLVVFTAPVSTWDLGTVPIWILPAACAAVTLSPGLMISLALSTCTGASAAWARLSAPRT